LNGAIKPAKQPIHHYTSSSGLLGILKEGVLWANEATSLNDVSEVHYGWDFIRNWFATQDQNDQV